MRVEHTAIDGSLVSIEADADLGRDAVATGWAQVPALMQAHPFAVHPAGHSEALERAARDLEGEVDVGDTREFELRGGSLRVGRAVRRTPVGRRRTVTVGAWEGTDGCLTTSLVGDRPDRLVEVFDSVDFDEEGRGLAIRSGVVPRPRVPEVTREVPEVGILSIRPAIGEELERVPADPGFQTDAGELFRIHPDSPSVMFVNTQVVARIRAVDAADIGTVAGSLDVRWSSGRR